MESSKCTFTLRPEAGEQPREYSGINAFADGVMNSVPRASAGLESGSAVVFML